MSVEYLPESPAQKVQRILLTIWIIVFSSVVMWMYILNRNLASNGQQAQVALCAFKLDLEVRAKSGEKFLREHPKGIPGIPASLIKTSLTNQRATLHSLHSLKCP